MNNPYKHIKTVGELREAIKNVDDDKLLLVTGLYGSHTDDIEVAVTKHDLYYQGEIEYFHLATDLMTG